MGICYPGEPGRVVFFLKLWRNAHELSELTPGIGKPDPFFLMVIRNLPTPFLGSLGRLVGASPGK